MNELRGQLVLPKIVPGMSEDAADMLYGTCAKWEEEDTISRIRTLYIFTDYLQTEDGSYLPGVKIGDGKHLISELPFFFSSAASGGNIDEELEDKIEEILRTKIGLDEDLENTINRLIREKVGVGMNEDDPTQIVFTTG